MSETTTLEPGTFLVMFTDGLTELPVEGGGLLGEDLLSERLAGIVMEAGASGGGGAPDVSAKLTALLDSLQVGMSQDDRTFLVVRRV